ncbi:ABC transporter substrate-binding protein [Actinopolymorpha alba]|uniref:ABC transporter substrate-binding protein n=1 Tax=Actinopolymorpha alba TaxID=533267 RepID=UPI0003615947|nr:ABC transporter substrate-binding protein [Actinopolymorpha alba]
MRTNGMKLPRRDLLGLGGAAFLTTVSLVGCDLSTEPTARKRGGSEDGQKLMVKEAPALAARVKAGDLPPLKERLPDKPLVISPADRLGVYGGTWHTALLGVADAVWMDRTIGYEGLLRWNPDYTKVIPNVAESWESSKDGRQYTFHLRRVMKWSDGEPFTADDIVFYQNDVLNNRDLSPYEPVNPVVAEKVDDYAVRFVYERPEGLFVKEHASRGGSYVRFPKHYLQQFHKKYNPNVDALVKKRRARDWMKLFGSKAGFGLGPGESYMNPECPTVYPWRTVTALGDGPTAVVERNPYYWKVDPEGRQLPYLDRVNFMILNEAEVMLAKAMNGEISMQNRTIGKPRNKPVLARNRDRGDYEFFETVPTSMNTTIIAFNLTHKDPAKRAVFTNKDFRIGLSHAINREEIIKVVFQRQGEPWQTSPRRESVFYHERLATQYLEYDPERANRHLDAAGYTRRDSGGIRLGPDGRPISMQVTFVTSWTPQWADVADLLKAYWKKVGVQVAPQAQDRSLWLERSAANDFDVQLWEGELGYDADVLLRPMWYLPLDGTITPGPRWRDWYNTRGARGEKPPELVARTLALYDQLQETPDETQQHALVKQIMDINAEMFNVIGISLPGNGYGIVKNNFHNVPASMRDSVICLTPGMTQPEQYFVE